MQKCDFFLKFKLIRISSLFFHQCHGNYLNQSRVTAEISQRFCYIPMVHIKPRHLEGWWPPVFKVMYCGGHILDVCTFTCLSMWPLFDSLPKTKNFKPLLSSFFAIKISLF